MPTAAIGHSESVAALHAAGETAPVQARTSRPAPTSRTIGPYQRSLVTRYAEAHERLWCSKRKPKVPQSEPPKPPSTKLLLSLIAPEKPSPPVSDKPLAKDWATPSLTLAFRAADDKAAEVLQALVNYPDRITIPVIRSITALVYSVPIHHITSFCMRRVYTRPRLLAMALARVISGVSCTRVGHFFDDRDHTTVQHACRKLGVTA